MDLVTLKMGLELGGMGLAALCVLFVVYLKMGQVSREKGSKG